MTGLKSISLSRENNISDISALAKLTNLTRLGLGDNNISDISALSGLTNLTRLSIKNNNIVEISSFFEDDNFKFSNMKDIDGWHGLYLGNNLIPFSQINKYQSILDEHFGEDFDFGEQDLERQKNIQEYLAKSVMKLSDEVLLMQDKADVLNVVEEKLEYINNRLDEHYSIEYIYSPVKRLMENTLISLNSLDLHWDNKGEVFRVQNENADYGELNKDIDLVYSRIQRLNHKLRKIGIEIEPTLYLKADNAKSSDRNLMNVEISKRFLDKLNKNDIQRICVYSSNAKITIDMEEFEKVEKDVLILAKRVSEMVTRSLIDNSSVLYEFNVIVDGENVRNFNNDIYICVSYNVRQGVNPNDLTVMYLKPSQEMESKGGIFDLDRNIMSFKTNHLSMFAVKENPVFFSDIYNHWANNSIKQLASRQIIRGVSKHKFDPNKDVTRAEFITMLVKALGISIIEDINYFDDVKKEHWHSSYVYTGFEKRIISGHKDRMFRPDANITREEMATVIGRVLDKFVIYERDYQAQKNILSEIFFDYEKIQEFSLEHVGVCFRYGLLKGNEDGNFDPGKNATRAEAITVIHKLMTFDY